MSNTMWKETIPTFNSLKKFSTQSVSAFVCIPTSVCMCKWTYVDWPCKKPLMAKRKKKKKSCLAEEWCSHGVLHLYSPDYPTAHFKAGFLWVNAAVHFVVMNGALLIEVPEALWGFKSISLKKKEYIIWHPCKWGALSL